MDDGKSSLATIQKDICCNFLGYKKLSKYINDFVNSLNTFYLLPRQYWTDYTKHGKCSIKMMFCEEKMMIQYAD